MKRYIAPKLIIHGNIEQITQNRNNCGRIDALGSAIMSPFGVPGGQCAPTGGPLGPGNVGPL